MVDFPLVSEVWKHTVKGGHYKIVGIIYNTITDRYDVHYVPLYESQIQNFSRQIEDHQKAFISTVYVLGESVPRFEKVGHIKDLDLHDEWLYQPKR